METSEKIKIANAACRGHEEAFDVEVPKRIRDFFAKGEGFAAEGRCFKAAPRGAANQPKGPGGEQPEIVDTFRVRATVPSWQVQSSLGPCDDGVVDVDGEWTNAGRFLPLFLMGDCRFAVADLEDSKCAVALFDEGMVGAEGGGYVPEVVAASLDEFLATLVDVAKPSFDIDDQEALWEKAASAVDEQDAD